jgi:hypothetical protein
MASSISLMPTIKQSMAIIAVLLRVLPDRLTPRYYQCATRVVIDT